MYIQMQRTDKDQKVIKDKDVMVRNEDRAKGSWGECVKGLLIEENEQRTK